MKNCLTCVVALPVGAQTRQRSCQSDLLLSMTGTALFPHFGHVSMIVSLASLDQNRQCGFVHAAFKVLIAARFMHRH